MKIIWNFKGGLPECIYYRLWAIISKRFGSIRIHNWLKEDDARHAHSHPYWFITFVLKGGYTDVSQDESGKETKEVLRALTCRYRPSNHMHQVLEVMPNTWTLLITGPSIHRWGFKVGNKIIKRDKYFATWGHHNPCDEDGKSVRIKPDGTRI